MTKLAKSLETITYRGLGPRENYVDSCAAAHDGIWQSDADSLGFDYLRPQENGNRTGVQWVVAQNEMRGLVFAASRPIEFSLKSYEDRDLMDTTHRAQLKERPYRVLHLDLQNSGLGSASCGPVPLKYYLVRPLPFSCKLALCPLGGRSASQAANYAQGLLTAAREV